MRETSGDPVSDCVGLLETEAEPLHVFRGVILSIGVSELVPEGESAGEALPAALNDPRGVTEL